MILGDAALRSLEREASRCGCDACREVIDLIDTVRYFQANYDWTLKKLLQRGGDTRMRRFKAVLSRASVLWLFGWGTILSILTKWAVGPHSG